MHVGCSRDFTHFAGQVAMSHVCAVFQKIQSKEFSLDDSGTVRPTRISSSKKYLSPPEIMRGYHRVPLQMAGICERLS
jgi:hypothetical protein